MRKFNEKNPTSRDFQKMVKRNGFEYIRCRGSHHIYKRNDKEIAIPNKLNRMIARRLIKENALDITA
ncbi:MAG: type II toxin-antitoxin system HicA family toxin [Alphaproteobacteria bacterium]|nr:type II toxin-antitoxin system HicA family toxin [Alphaproteobacteria bacterium]